jgi:hypothetical protein
VCVIHLIANVCVTIQIAFVFVDFRASKSNVHCKIQYTGELKCFLFFCFDNNSFNFGDIGVVLEGTE